jgi:hypothetical protein
MVPAIRHTPAEQAADWITGHLPPLPNYRIIAEFSLMCREAVAARMDPEPAFLMPQDAVDDAGIGNKGDDAYAAAAGAKKWIRFEYLLYQPSPLAAGLPAVASS